MLKLHWLHCNVPKTFRIENSGINRIFSLDEVQQLDKLDAEAKLLNTNYRSRNVSRERPEPRTPLLANVLITELQIDVSLLPSFLHSGTAAPGEECMPLLPSWFGRHIPKR